MIRPVVYRCTIGMHDLWVYDGREPTDSEKLRHKMRGELWATRERAEAVKLVDDTLGIQWARVGVLS